MTVLYDILRVSDLNHLTTEQRKDFIAELVVGGNHQRFEKYRPLFEGEIESIFSEDKILELLPCNIDDSFFEYILSRYDFKNRQHFFYNYAYHSDSMQIKEMVYNYFVENFSHIIFDNMDMYDALIEK